MGQKYYKNKYCVKCNLDDSQQADMLHPADEYLPGDVLTINSVVVSTSKSDVYLSYQYGNGIKGKPFQGSWRWAR